MPDDGVERQHGQIQAGGPGDGGLGDHADLVPALGDRLAHVGRLQLRQLLGVGLDLLKFDKKGDTFTTLFVTPRGPQLFLGRSIAQGFSLGAIASTRKSGVALLWSAVL